MIETRAPATRPRFREVLGGCGIGGVLVLAASSGALAQPPPERGTPPERKPAPTERETALIVEGVKQRHNREFDQALANFLEAYARSPSPSLLLEIAATLQDMGRLADAANTYQRYVLDPAAGGERVAEIKHRLQQLDDQLTILIVRVGPRGADLSIDGGPFIPVGSSLRTRVRPGIHLIRIRNGDAIRELTVNGFEGERKEIPAAIAPHVAAPPADGTTGAMADPTKDPSSAESAHAMPPTAAHVEGWLITGTHYRTDRATGPAREVRAGYAGPVIAASVPRVTSTATDVATTPPSHDAGTSAGVIALVRIDGDGRGFAGGAGLVIAHGPLDVELMLLKSASTGGYLGLRYRLLTGWLRPYLGVGLPGFAFDQIEDGSEPSKQLAIGIRGAAGIELRINGHVSVHGDLGYEHFFVDQMTTGIDANLFVPTLGVVGRL